MGRTYASSPCVRSGHCCKTGPCAFGDWDAERRRCRHLAVDHVLVANDGTQAEVHRCERYEFIRQQPMSEINPAFGAGCGSTLFNEPRARIIHIHASRARKS